MKPIKQKTINNVKIILNKKSTTDRFSNVKSASLNFVLFNIFNYLSFFILNIWTVPLLEEHAIYLEFILNTNE